MLQGRLTAVLALVREQNLLKRPVWQRPRGYAGRALRSFSVVSLRTQTRGVSEGGSKVQGSEVDLQSIAICKPYVLLALQL